MATLLAKGLVQPNKIRIVEGKTLLERAQKALDALRRKEASGERLVRRIAGDEYESSEDFLIVNFQSDQFLKFFKRIKIPIKI
ncbi:hypothetical protein NHQ30_006384 [Ciborinia camelliae]|nr:hypothetical protein NHQ30_006384 [Ciborinia camelliae]